MANGIEIRSAESTLCRNSEAITYKENVFLPRLCVFATTCLAVASDVAPCSLICVSSPLALLLSLENRLLICHVLSVAGIYQDVDLLFLLFFPPHIYSSYLPLEFFVNNIASKCDIIEPALLLAAELIKNLALDLVRFLVFLYCCLHQLTM